MDKTIIVDGKEVKFRATARTPRLYRAWIGRDMIQDMSKLAKSYDKALNSKHSKDKHELDEMDLTIFENVSWVMAKQADLTVPDTPDEWLDCFDMFDIYKILPDILVLWKVNNQTTSTAKKK